jgi:hydroxypyruvate reductase
MNIESFIEENDSYHFHQKIGGLIKTGSTGTNVNDLILILGHKSTII